MKSGVFFTSELKPLFLKLTFVSKSSCLRGILTALTSSRKVYIPRNTGGSFRHGETVSPECTSAAFRFPFPYGHKKKPRDIAISRLSVKRRLPTLPLVRSTIGVAKLNFSVRNGKRWNLRAIVTLISFQLIMNNE